MTNEQIENKIRQIKAIWGIESMEITPTLESNARAFLAKEITDEEFKKRVLEELSHEI